MTYDTKPNWGKWKHFHIVKLWQAVALWADINPDRVHYGPGAVHLAGFPGDWIVDMAPAPAAFTDRLDVAISNLRELKVEHMVSGRPAEWDITLASFAARVRSFEGFTATNNQKLRSGITHLFSKNPLWGQCILFNAFYGGQFEG